MQDRQRQLEHWLQQCLADRGERLLAAPEPLVADASFRRFARIRTDAGDRVLMDAPAERENNTGFVTVATWLAERNLAAARLLAIDHAQGFLLVTDLGDETLARALARRPETEDALYDAAVDALIAFQAAGTATMPPFPAYDLARLELENRLFGQWFLNGLLTLDAAPPVLNETLAALTETHLAAPRVPVHLDWHSRNLMVSDQGLAMVDFQDARIGPQGYDLVSLLRDCYRTLPGPRIDRLTGRFLAGARAAELPGCGSDEAFLRYFDLVGVQRHLKAIGIFARLHLRDGRDHALPDIPRTLDHVLAVAPRHPETRALAQWLQTDVLPRYRERHPGDGAAST